jgi:hypothetical protein
MVAPLVAAQAAPGTAEIGQPLKDTVTGEPAGGISPTYLDTAS